MTPLDIDAITRAEFEALPLVVEGESKIIRRLSPTLGLIRLKPTVYSYTANRYGVLPGSDDLRLRATRVLVPLLKKRGIKHAFREIGERYILTDLIDDPPPIEVVWKAAHVGTPKHRYYGMAEALREQSARHAPPGDRYPNYFVRFDWRNPLHHPDTGARLADEVLPEPMAEWFIDTTRAQSTANHVALILRNTFRPVGVDVLDFCLFIDKSGETVFSEISPDMGRFRAMNGDSLDKDAWRRGDREAQVLQRWTRFVEICESLP